MSKVVDFIKAWVVVVNGDPELFESEDMTSITFIACGLIFFYGKIFLEYLEEKIYA